MYPKNWLSFLLFGLILSCVAVPVVFPVAAHAAGTTTSAMGDVKNTLDQVVSIVENFPGEANTGTRRQKMREVIQPRFDFQEMAKRSLGTFWQEATPEQQKEYVTLFSELLATTYLNKIETVKRDMVKIESENLDFPKCVVKTTVHNKGGVFPIDYKLQNVNGDWKVYDVVIENIGLVANYRNEFAGIIRKERMSGLIERLKLKTQKM